MLRIAQIKDLQSILDSVQSGALWTVIPSFSLNGANVTVYGALDLKLNGVVRFDGSNDKLYYVIGIQSVPGGEFEYTLNEEPVGDEASADFINDVLDIASLKHYTKGETDTILLDKADLVGGIVPAEQLPSYVDDVIEGYYSDPTFYEDMALTTPIVPSAGKIYVNLSVDPATTYRWSGSVYVQINVSYTETQIKDFVGNILTDSTTIDFTYTTPTSITADVKDDSITFAKMQEIPTMTFLGNIAAITANPTAVESVQMFVGVPANSGVSGEQGQFSFDANYIYLYIGTEWARIPRTLGGW